MTEYNLLRPIVTLDELQDSFKKVVPREGNEAENLEGKVVWRCTSRREIQHDRRGLVLVRTATTKDKVGHPCTTASKKTIMRVGLSTSLVVSSWKAYKQESWWKVWHSSRNDQVVRTHF